MPVEPGPHDLETLPVVLGPGGDASPRAMGPGFYEALDRDFDGFAGHLLIAKHVFEEAWPTWEMHPAGDEIVYLLFGEVDFVLWTGTGEEVLRVDRPGSYVVVPKGTWHTARPRRPSGLLFVTPGEGTQNTETPGGS